MSAPLVADGEYKIIHATFSSQAVELLHGVPLAAVSGYKEATDPPRPGQSWMVRNIGDGQIIFESATVPGSYVNARAHVRAGPLTGAPNPTVWMLEPAGPDQFRILTEDGVFCWFLHGAQNAAAVLLSRSVQSEMALWKFKPI